MDRGAWETTIHGVAESLTRLSDFTSLFPFHHVCSLQQAMQSDDHRDYDAHTTCSNA